MTTAASLDLTLTALLIGMATAFVQATFQLGTSVLTLLSGHSLGTRRSHRRLLALNTSYIIGSIAVTAGLVFGLSTAARMIPADYQRVAWTIIALVAVVVGYFTLIAYYRSGKGTRLWLPRRLAEYLHDRAKKTSRAIEAGTLGGLAVICELPFTIAPLLIAALLIVYQAAPISQFAWTLLYAGAASLPLVIITVLIGGGHRVSAIQRWREHNKNFLRYSGGIGLVMIALYVGVFYVAGSLV